MKYWKKHSQAEIHSRVFTALDKNINYSTQSALGIPASYLDDKVFYQDSSIVKDAPFISTLIQNPNHIGCHTLDKSESFFSGTQELEKELINICAVDILKGKEGQHDGYLASGGTEANLQAIWIYRNYFIKEDQATKEEICIICSEDSHYSMDKGGNIFSLDVYKISVDFNTRVASKESIKKSIQQAKEDGKKHFIVICNMMTTMFGSVDNIDDFTDVLKEQNCNFKLHIDGAFGGFYYPFSSTDSKMTFNNPHITSFTMDAHKMAQAPYGTGIFLIRKNYMHYTNTKEASYVEGEDYTLIGSRSGANAVATWMILVKNGPFGWDEKIYILHKRASWLCKNLRDMGIEFYRHLDSNILTIKADYVDKKIAKEYGLVPDNHDSPKWYKIVIMEHVIIEKLMALVDRLKDNK